MADNISIVIDSFAQKNQKLLKMEEGKTGRSMTKYDVAQYMLQNGVLKQTDFDKWLKTQEGAFGKQETERLNKLPIFMVRQQNAGKTSYLDEVSEFSIGNVMGFTKTGESKPVQKKNFDVKKQLEEQKFQQHIKSLPETDKDALTLTREIEASKAENGLTNTIGSHTKWAWDSLQFAVKDLAEGDKNFYRKFSGALDSKNYSAISALIGEYFEQAGIMVDSGLNHILNDILVKAGPEQLGEIIYDTLIDDKNDNNISGLEKGTALSERMCAKVLKFAFSKEGLGVAALPTLINTLPANVANYVTSSITAPMIADGIENGVNGTIDAYNAETWAEINSAGDELGDAAIELSAGLGIAKATIGKGKSLLKAKTSNPTEAAQPSQTPKPKTTNESPEVNNLVKSIKETLADEPQKCKNLLAACIIDGKYDAGKLQNAVEMLKMRNSAANPEPVAFDGDLKGAQTRQGLRDDIYSNSSLLDNDLQLKNMDAPTQTAKGQLPAGNKYYDLGQPRTNTKTGQTVFIFENMREVDGFDGLRGKNPLGGRNIKGIEFKLRKLKEAGIETIIDFRAEGECNDNALKAIKNQGMSYYNFHIEDGIWDLKNVQRIPDFLKAMNKGKFFAGCANGQARTDLGMVINYILNPKAQKIPQLYYNQTSSGRLSVSKNIRQIKQIIDENPQLIKDMGWDNIDEFNSAFVKRFKDIQAIFD